MDKRGGRIHDTNSFKGGELHKALIVDHIVQANVADSTYGQYQSGRPAVGNNQMDVN